MALAWSNAQTLFRVAVLLVNNYFVWRMKFILKGMGVLCAYRVAKAMLEENALFA
jgi:hypothetical protein